MDAAAGPGRGPSLDKDAMRRLESLGYVGGGALPNESSSALEIEDPKDFLPVFEHLQALNSLFSAKRYREAKKGCLSFVSLHPRYFLPHIWLGMIALEERRPADATRHFSTAMSILTESGVDATRLPLTAEARDYAMARCHMGRGCALIQEGKSAQAIVELEKALRVDPEFFAIQYNLGIALREQGRIGEAVVHLRKALRINPDSALAHSHLALALHGQGEFAEAVAQYEEAVADYQKTSETVPEYAQTLNNLAWLLATCSDGSVRDGAKAVAFAEKAIGLLGERTPTTLDTLAAAYAETQQFPMAVEAAQEAILLGKSAQQGTPVDPIQSRLALYRAGRPYREAARSAAPAGPSIKH